MNDLKYDPIYKELEVGYPNISIEAIESAVQFKIVASELFNQKEELFTHYGLTTGRFQLLMILKAEESHRLSPSMLASRTNVTRATMTQFVDALEKDCYVKRCEDPKDRRGMLVELTPVGFAKLNEILPHYLKSMSHFTDILNAEERLQFITLMGKIHSGFSQA